MGDEVLAAIAHDLVESIRRSVTIDWTKKESVRARMRSKIKRLLKRHGYPPDKTPAAVVTVIEQAEQVCKDWAMAEKTTTSAEVVPFRRLQASEVVPYENAVPLYELKVAAGRFSEDQVVTEADCEWVALDGRLSPAPDLFVAQVVGESMNRRIPNGAWCVWRLNPSGTRQGKVVLAQHRDINDPEHGGQYTVKVYDSEKEATQDGGWQHTRITLKPDSTDAAFTPIVLENLEDGELTIVAELLEVLR